MVPWALATRDALSLHACLARSSHEATAQTLSYQRALSRPSFSHLPVPFGNFILFSSINTQLRYGQGPGRWDRLLVNSPRLDERNKRSGIWECGTQGTSVGQENLCGPLCPGAGKMLETSASFPAWQLQRNREGTAQRQLLVSFSHPPPPASPAPQGARSLVV